MALLDEDASITWWLVEPIDALPASLGAHSRVQDTLRTSNSGSTTDVHALDEYIAERAGWVDPLHEDFSSLHQSRPSIQSTDDAGRFAAVTVEYIQVAGVPIRVRAFHRTEQKGSLTKASGEEIWDHLRSIRKQEGTDPYAIVWLQPADGHPSSPEWGKARQSTIEGFLGTRMHASDLEWVRVNSWLSVIHTPWATFATWSDLTKRAFRPVLDARVRHLVVDPVVLATAHRHAVQGFVRTVASLDTNGDSDSSAGPQAVRDDFYRWRARNWWPQPAKTTIANTVWKGAVAANNTESQVESLSREVADYAAVEESRHNARLEQQNAELTWQSTQLAEQSTELTKRGTQLGWGGLIFAVLAIAIPVAYEEVGLLPALLIGAALAGLSVLVTLAVLRWLKRSTPSDNQQSSRVGRDDRNE